MSQRETSAEESTGPAETRFPRSLYRRGAEPDARFSLANERTFLAWITTGLALVSVGVGLEAVATALQPTLRLAAALVLVTAGSACPVQAWIGWTRTEAALREGRPLPPPALLWVLPVVLVVAGVLVALAVVRS